MVRTDEIRDAGTLTGRVLDDVGAIVGGVHRASADRTFRALGPIAAPVRVMHDGISTIAHGSTRLGLRSVPAVAGLVGSGVAYARGAATTSVFDSPGGRAVLSAVAGILGDTVEREHPSLAPPLTIRTHRGPARASGHDGGDLSGGLRRDLAAEPGGASGRVVVFAHGLCESDLSWSLGARRHWDDPDVTFGSLLQRDAAWTPLYSTYNSGRHVSDNGRDAARLLAATVAAWPVPVTSVALVGHSMGGLVLRSVGVKDLRHGAVVAADWEGVDLDSDRTDRCTVVQFPDGVRVHAIGVTLARRHDSAFGRRAGDLLVQFDSAGSRGHATRTIPSNGVHHIGGLHHFDLLSHPAVYAVLRDWLR